MWVSFMGVAYLLDEVTDIAWVDCKDCFCPANCELLKGGGQISRGILED